MSDDTTHHHDHGDGLHEDLARLATRRDALRLFGAGGAATLLGALGASQAFGTTPTGLVPTETGGPYPGDGSNGPNVLDDSGIVRHDIRRSFGSSRTLAKGVPLRVNLTVTQAAKDYAPLVGAAVYLWHCDRAGRYSMYSQGVTEENYLRGIARTGERRHGLVQDDLPGAPTPGAGRTSTSRSTPPSRGPSPAGRSSRPRRSRSPGRPSKRVYATSGYAGSTRNLAQSSLASDMVFADDRAIHQLATVTGSVAKGFVANLTIAV